MLGSTLLRLAHIPGVDGAQMSSWIHDSISKLEEALEISKDDHEAMYLLATTHYKLFTRVKERYEEFYDRLFARADEEYDEPFAYFDQLNGGFYVEHCRKAYGYFKYLKEKAPEVYERDPDVLNRIQRSVPRDMLDSNLDYKSDTETMNTIDPGLSQKMEEEEMIQDSISKLEEALEINKDDHDAMYLLANAHYMLFTRAERYSDFYVDHCRKAYGYFKYLKEKAPEVYERDPDVLKRIRWYLPQGMLDSNLDYKSFTGTMNTIDPSLSLYFHERSQTMEEEEMIQAEVEKLLAALPYDDNSELFEKLAEFSHRHKKKSKTKQLASF